MHADKFVYLIRRDSDGAHKIGITKDLLRRVHTLNAETGEMVVAVTHGRPIEYYEARREEWKWHKRLSKYCIGGEWFNLPKRMIPLVKAAISETRSPKINPKLIHKKKRHGKSKKYPCAVFITEELKNRLKAITMKKYFLHSVANYAIQLYVEKEESKNARKAKKGAGK